MTYRDRQRLADIQAAIDAIRLHLHEALSRQHEPAGLLQDPIVVKGIDAKAVHAMLESVVDAEPTGDG